jgi:tetratricopeptide (TPR) repeat protein
MQRQIPNGQNDASATQALREALALLKAGRAAEARSLLVPLREARPDLAQVRRLLAFAHLGLGDPRAAEHEFAAAARIDPRDPSFPACLGELAFDQGRSIEAEAAWRASLAIDPCHVPAAIGLARMLTALGRPQEALAVTGPPVRRGLSDPRLLDAHAAALSAAGRFAEALETRRRIAAQAPSQPIAQQNLAAAFLHLGSHGQALAASERARALGGDNPELHYLHARALQGMDRFEEAERAYRAALALRPGYAEAARDLAQLIWMRTGALEQAIVPLVDAAAADPRNPKPGLFRASLRESSGDEAGAYADLAVLASRFPDAADVQVAAAKLAIAVDPHRALPHLEQARRLAVPPARLGTIEAAVLLALGEPQRAATLLEALHRRSPKDQSLIAFLATAWRMTGDPRYRALYDYERLVGCSTTDCPPGWPDLPAYLAALAGELHALHPLSAHPVGQSLRQGTMAERNLLECDTPAIRAFQQAVAGPLSRYIERLGPGTDPVRSRAGAAGRISGIWTVRLNPGGYHVNHVHPMGWLSSACYIELPETIGSDRQGWLKLGEPGIRTSPELPAEHHVRPEAGRLVLFPSYMWHGTVPFSGRSPRLTIAFDVLPAHPGIAH